MLHALLHVLLISSINKTCNRNAACFVDRRNQKWFWTVQRHLRFWSEYFGATLLCPQLMVAGSVSRNSATICRQRRVSLRYLDQNCECCWTVLKHLWCRLYINTRPCFSWYMHSLSPLVYRVWLIKIKSLILSVHHTERKKKAMQSKTLIYTLMIGSP